MKKADTNVVKHEPKAPVVTRSPLCTPPSLLRLNFVSLTTYFSSLLFFFFSRHSLFLSKSSERSRMAAMCKRQRSTQSSTTFNFLLKRIPNEAFRTRPYNFLFQELDPPLQFRHMVRVCISTGSQQVACESLNRCNAL